MTEMENLLNKRKEQIEQELQKEYQYVKNTRINMNVYEHSRVSMFFCVNAFTINQKNDGVILIGYADTKEEVDRNEFEDGDWMLISEMSLAQMLASAIEEIEIEANASVERYSIFDGCENKDGQ